MSVTGLGFLPVAGFSQWFLSNRSHCSLVLSSCLIGCQSDQVYHHHLLRLVREEVRRVVSAPPSITLNLCAVSFFHFGGGRFLSNDLTLTLHSLMEVSTICFATSSSAVFLKVSLTSPVLSNRSCCLLLHPLMPLPVVLSFLRLSCYFRPRFLMPLFHHGFALLLLNAHPFWVSRTTLFWPCPWNGAGMAWWVILLQVAANSSGTHHCPGSIPSTFGGALQLDAHPHALSSVLWKFPLWPFHKGLPQALLQTLSPIRFAP
jgi:hypothetical protein